MEVGWKKETNIEEESKREDEKGENRGETEDDMGGVVRVEERGGWE